MKVVILSGGYGTRLLEETVVKPKPMVEIGGRPILWHLMNIYASYGFKEFVVALGYRGDWIKSYFMQRYHMQGNLTVNLADGNIQPHEKAKEDWLIHLIDTGLETGTAGRLMRLKNQLKDEPFMLTYGDGLSNVDVSELLKCHKSHGKIATVTAVRQPARFGVLTMAGDSSRVAHFAEKPQLSEGWVNGGFFVMEPEIINYLDDESAMIEYGPMQRLSNEGQLYAYKHEGFWQCMDTLRDVRYLEGLWASPNPPWKTWKD